MEHCCRDIKTWMLENRLKLNGDKTEVLLCGSSFLQTVTLIEHIQICESQISLSASVRDLGLVIDANLDMTAHISSVIKSFYHHLRSLGKLRPFLTQDAGKGHCGVSHVQAGLLWGIQPNQLNRLQKIQKAAARIVTRTKSRERVHQPCAAVITLASCHQTDRVQNLLSHLSMCA